MKCKWCEQELTTNDIFITNTNTNEHWHYPKCYALHTTDAHKDGRGTHW